MFVVGPLRANVPTRWTNTVSAAKNNIYFIALKCPESSVKYAEAIVVRNHGERPKRVMLVPDATPIYSGKVLEAANMAE